MANPQKIIAVVDDDPEMRAAVASLLVSFGYSAETFDFAATFLTCASTTKAACLVIDIQLGDISGVELAHQLVADGYSYPLIFMTGLNDERVPQPSRRLGRRCVSTQAISDKIIDRCGRKGCELARRGHGVHVERYPRRCRHLVDRVAACGHVVRLALGIFFKKERRLSPLPRAC